MKLALSLLCEHPVRRTGLTSLFTEFVHRSVEQFPDLQWIVYAAPDFPWTVQHPRVQLLTPFPGTDELKRRIFTDHFRFGPHARSQHADALVTVGLVPLFTGGLPVAMHMLSLQHLDSNNKVGFARGLYRSWVANNGLYRADLVITNTRFACSQILGVAPQVEPKLLQSYEGLQHEQFHPNASPGEPEHLLKSYGIKPGYLFWCSNFYPYKQAEKLFAAYALLPEELRLQMPLVMAGGKKWGSGWESAESAITTLKLEPYVKVLDWVPDEDLGLLYRHARVFVMASREETFGRCVLEAMACGTPCVVNRIPVMDEVTGGFAQIINFDDATLSAKALHTAACDEKERTTMRVGALKHAQLFSFDKLASERIAAIQRMLTSSSAS
jgi:glycosyltransferase involved in cell wall biosynthesis